MKKNARDYCALALDNADSLDQIKALVNNTSQYIGICKVGLEQFTRFGPAILDVVRSSDRKIFLDLKLHDIPNTVAQAVAAAAIHNVDFLTLHTFGGSAMLSAAADAAKKQSHPPRLVGVTVLTSIDQQSLNSDLLVNGTVPAVVGHLATLAATSGLGGIVCSAADLAVVKPLLPGDFEIITPGIRLADGDAHDQKRVATPQAAIAAGATILVIGRAVTGAKDPAAAAEQVFVAVSEALEQRR
jgi:orotidine-5'-phosphate decarboxylase